MSIPKFRLFQAFVRITQPALRSEVPAKFVRCAMVDCSVIFVSQLRPAYNGNAENVALIVMRVLPLLINICSLSIKEHAPCHQSG